MNPDTVMVVEDDPFAREFLVLHIEQMGLRALCAGSGSLALEVMRRTLPHLLLLDINMPGMSGFELLKTIKGRVSGSLPVIMTTASAESADVHQALGLGADGYVLKPVKPDVLRRRIGRYVRLPRDPNQLSSAVLPTDVLGRFRAR